jgi:large subunit ribosomal protein L4
MKLDVFNSQGKSTGRSVELPEEIFGAEPNNHVIYLAVKQYLAAQRQGTHKVKTRAEVKGASRKLHKQKGTGGSRKGNIRNPLYKGGGTIFGPKPHAYDIKLNRKVKDLAKISALSHKAKSQSIVVLEDLKMEKPQTKQFAGILSNLKLNDKKEAKCFTQKVNALVKSMWLKATNKVRFWKAKVKPSKSHKRRALLLKP